MTKSLTNRVEERNLCTKHPIKKLLMFIEMAYKVLHCDFFTISLTMQNLVRASKVHVFRGLLIHDTRLKSFRYAWRNPYYGFLHAYLKDKECFGQIISKLKIWRIQGFALWPSIYIFFLFMYKQGSTLTVAGLPGTSKSSKLWW